MVPEAQHEVMTLTPAEVLLETARQVSVYCNRPTRVRKFKVEVLFGDVWLEYRPTPEGVIMR